MKGNSLKNSSGKRQLIIPAAGFGTRVGSPEAKELMLRPMGCHASGLPMIELAIRLAQTHGAKSHVITRDEKENLKTYLGDRVCDIQIVTPTKEWPETILLSSPYWDDFNVVCLPDTDFSPLSILEELFAKLEKGAEIVFATVQKSDLSTLGAVRVCEKEVYHCEKPTEFEVNDQAWGLFGFRRPFGEALLKNMLMSTFDHKWRSIHAQVGVVAMSEFRDLTRG